MECRLSSSTGTWSCKVSIRWEFDHKGAANAEVSEIPFGAPIYNKDQVELRLRQAQCAILCSTVPADTFLSLSSPELKLAIQNPKKSLMFSRNVVCVDL